MLPLLPDNHPLLKTVMIQYDFSEVDAVVFARAMATTLIDAMDYHNAVGIAANQIGIEQRAFVMKNGNDNLVMINPTITAFSDQQCKLEEGCLSFAGVEILIKRPCDCSVEYYTTDGELKKIDLQGWESRIAQHEYDHLNGITFFERASRLRAEMARLRFLKKK